MYCRYIVCTRGISDWAGDFFYLSGGEIDGLEGSVTRLRGGGEGLQLTKMGKEGAALKVFGI